MFHSGLRIVGLAVFLLAILAANFICYLILRTVNKTRPLEAQLGIYKYMLRQANIWEAFGAYRDSAPNAPLLWLLTCALAMAIAGMFFFFFSR